MTGGGASRRHSTHAALAVDSRAQLLDLLRADERPRTVNDLAEASGLHVNTVRFHMDVLAKAGLVSLELDRTGRRGRPRSIYTATHEQADTSYQLLANTLARHWAGSAAERARRAEQAGYGMAPAFERDRPETGTVLLEAVHEVATVFERMGFQPDVVPVDDREAQLRLRHCPFRAVAAEYPEVVCSMHLGMIKRMLDDSRAPAATARLDPFVEPSLCVAHVSAIGPSAGET